MRTNDTQFNYLFEKIYELVELADFDIDDEDLLEAAKAVIDNLELDERFYHKKNITDEHYSECVDKLVDSMWQFTWCLLLIEIISYCIIIEVIK